VSQFPDHAAYDRAAIDPPRTPGTAIASIVVSILGLCVPLLGVFGMVLGILGYVQSRARQSSVAAAVIGTILGFITTIPWLLVAAAMFIPAFSGYEAARRYIAVGYMAMIGQALNQHAARNAGDYPAPGTDLHALFGVEVPPFVWDSPLDTAGEPAFLLVYESTDPPHQPTWIILNPDIRAAKQIPMYELATEDMQMVAPGEAVRLIGTADLFTTDGRPWTLKGPVP